jgi:hypothetical protein
MTTELREAIARKRLGIASSAYLAWASLAAAVAIVQDRPAEFGGTSSGLSVWKDFAFGMGTALSPPLWWMIVQAIFTALVARKASGPKSVTVGIGVLTLSGLAEFIGAAGEPITLQAFKPATFNPLLAVVQAGMIALPAVLAIAGVRAWRSRRRGATLTPSPG